MGGAGGSGGGGGRGWHRTTDAASDDAALLRAVRSVVAEVSETVGEGSGGGARGHW